MKLTDKEFEEKYSEEINKIQSVNTKTIKLDWQDELALTNIDALKEELVNMIRIPNKSHKDSFEIIPEKKNKLNDDRAYTMCMCAYALQQERRKNITQKKRPQTDAKSLVSSLPMRAFNRKSMFK